MGGHLFVSYSRSDGGEFALRLADELQAGPPSYAAWVDVREMQPGQEDWDRQLVEAIKTCTAVLFVMTEDSVRDESGCKPEWVAGLRYKKPIVPVRLHSRAELPFRLSSRQFIDFSDSLGTGLAQLRKHLSWRDTPAGVLADLRHRLADAEYELPRAPLAQRSRIEEEFGELRRRIEEQQRVVQSPQAAVEQTGARIGAGMEREREPERPVVAAARAKFVNPPPMTAPAYFQDRHVESELIGAFLREDGLRMLSVVGRGGVGKTAMVCRLLKALEAGRLPDDLGELAVDGIVYLSPRGHPVNFPNLFGDLGRLLPEDVAEALVARYRDPQESPAALVRALLEAFPAGRTVVLLDNFEELVDADAVGLTDAALDEALHAMLSAPVHGVKVIITTRVAPRDLLLAQPGVQRRLDLDEGLPSPFAEQVLRARDPDGKLGVRDAPDALLAEAQERTRGFPRALEALVAILAADRSTTLPELLADTRGMPENVVEPLVGEAFSRLDALSQQVMQALAIYTSPVPPVAVDYLLQPFEPAIDSAPVLSRLVNMSFVRRDAGQYYVHQVDRDYALHRIALGDPRDRDPEPLPFTQYALRDRGAGYFEQIRTPRETWRTLTDLAPQLAEFELRYQADDYDTAAHVLLDIDFDYLVVWGHYRLVLELHHRLQDHLTDPGTDSASKGTLGLCYAALGETRRAIELHEQALAIAREIGDRQGESANLGSLGLCYSTLGETRRAIELHEQALAINQEIGNRQGKSIKLTNLGDCHADLGMWEQAAGYCEQAIRIADQIGFAQVRSEGRLSLATVQLHAGKLDAALETVQAAPADGYPPTAADLALIRGIALARQDKRDAARQAFTEAVRRADTLIEQTHEDYHALDTKALALCGVVLIDDIDRITEASAMFRAARAINQDKGTVRRVLRLFDALAVADRSGILGPVHHAAAGHKC
jgi:tetratricopeptide (TPR) repeat protein